MDFFNHLGWLISSEFELLILEQYTHMILNVFYTFKPNLWGEETPGFLHIVVILIQAFKLKDNNLTFHCFKKTHNLTFFCFTMGQKWDY